MTLYKLLGDSLDLPGTRWWRAILLPALLALITQAGCSDDGFAGPADGGARDRGPGSEAAVGKDGSPKQDKGPGPEAGGKQDLGAQDLGKQDLGVKLDSTVKPDGPVVSKLPKPPAGAVLLRISVDDSVDKTYAGQELQLKGAFAYNAATNVITPDSQWTGPPVPLYDDGPAGLEGQGSVAGDHKLGTIVYLVPPSGGASFEYGLISPAGWMWPDGPNQKVTVQPGAALTNLQSCTLAPRAGVDLLFTVDNKYLSGASIEPGSQAVTIRGNFSHWAPLLCNDEGKAGDSAAGDKIHSCLLSAQVGKGRPFPHLGLARPGQKVRFYVTIDGSSYKKGNGVTAALSSGGAFQKVTVGMDGSDLAFTVPSSAATMAAPAPQTGPLPAGRAGNLAAGAFTLPTTVYSSALGDTWMQVPSTYDAHRAVPLLVSLHGYTGTGKQMLATWKTLAEDQGFLLLAPMGMTGKLYYADWDLNAVFTPSPQNTVLEEKPLLDAVSWIKGRYNVAAGLVAVEGFSDGASFALHMGLNNGQVFCAAMANSAGGVSGGYGSPKPRVYVSHGTNDSILPYSSGTTIVAKLKSAGYSVDFVSLSGVDHVFPTWLKVPMIKWWWTGCGGNFPP